MVVIDKISNRPGYDFLFTTSAIKLAGPVTLNVANADLKELLTLIFDHQPLGFTFRFATAKSDHHVFSWQGVASEKIP